MIDFDLGDSRLIRSECMRQGLLRNQAAYVLATAYWETARTMKPVVEAFWLSEDWRKKNLRYYPWHGRGFVQLTWERNYVKCGQELGIDMTTDPNVALEPDVAATVLVVGMREGWFTGKRLDEYVTLQKSNFVGARRIVNGTDKAQAISEIAREYDAALSSAGYGVEKDVPVINDRRDGSAPRSNPAQSTTIWATIATAVSGATGVFSGFGELPERTQHIVALCGAVAVISLIWIARERIRKWGQGDA